MIVIKIKKYNFLKNLKSSKKIENDLNPEKDINVKNSKIKLNQEANNNNIKIEKQIYF